MEAVTPLAVLYDPYIDTLGGGERYTLTIAETLLKMNWQVVLAWNDQSVIKKATDRFGLNLSSLAISKEFYDLFTNRSALQQRHNSLKNADLVFILSDGSVPIMFGKKTFLHYQVPFTSTNRPGLLNRLKLLSVNQIIVNSQFTQKVIDRTLRTNKTKVLYPPVDTDSLTPGKKENIILNVGRFASPSHSKRQDVLITAFKNLVEDGLKDWKLILAGGKHGTDSVLDDLKEMARGYPVEFLVNPKYDKLKNTYAKAKIYWHAAGFEVDEKLNPEAVEHFGITTVEAMAAGVVPIVVNKGGQKEIITKDSGYLWNDLDKLEEVTKKVIKSPTILQKKSKAAQNRSQAFSQEKFISNLKILLS